MTVVAACQLGLAVGEGEANLAAAAAAIAAAAGHGAELVVLPELCDSGYVFTGEAEARALASPADGSPTLREWQALAARYGLTIVGGFCELGEEGLVYNSAAVVGPDGPWPSTARRTCGMPRSSFSRPVTRRRPSSICRSAGSA